MKAPPLPADLEPTFLQELRTQRWDDHRYYHHCRINQSLHLVSALSFLGAYALIAFDPIAAVLLGWVVAMVTRQIGHFFFEPKGYDAVNRATHDHKEAIKVGYNLRRKVVLLSIWAACPIVLAVRPDLFGALTPHENAHGFVRNLCVVWLWVGVAAVASRTAWLCMTRDVKAGLVWCTKILTDPFHDVMLYHRAPLHLLRGQRYDPMTGAATNVETTPRALPGTPDAGSSAR